jgi:FkbM family methyltransferase
MKRGAERLFARAGYTVIPAWREHSFPQAKYLRQLFAFAKVGCVLDVGANLGQYYDFLRNEVGFDGWVISFEPNPRLASSLRDRSRSESRWIVEGCALGQAVGELEFGIRKDPQFSSFLEADHSATDLFHDENEVVERVAVPVRTLNDVVPAVSAHESVIGSTEIYLKIDTQGYDLEVLAGASDVIGRIAALQTEIAVKPIYAGATPYHQAMPRIESFGFDLSAIFPNNSGHFPQLIEFDCHFISRARCGSPVAPPPSPNAPVQRSR